MSVSLLHNFCKSNAVYTKQGSKEWHDMRQNMIGGSEISSFSGTSSLTRLAKAKLGLTTFFTNAAMRWGSVFEAVSRHLMAQIFHTKVYEVGNLPVLRDDNGKVVHGISPDGFAILRELNTIMNYFNALFNKEPITVIDKPEYICMFEFKSPTSREITDNVPSQYVKQMLSELSAMPFADYCLYVDTSFKLRPMDSKIGIIRGWFAILSQKETNNRGDLSNEDIDCIFKMYLGGGYEIWQPKEFYFDEEDNTQEDLSKCSQYAISKGLYVWGYVPWYLENALIKPIERNPEFPFNLREKIIDFMDYVNNLRNKSVMEQITELEN